MKTKDYSKRKLLLISILSLSVVISSFGQNSEFDSENLQNQSGNKFLADQEEMTSVILNDSIKKEPKQWNDSFNKWLNATNWNPYYFNGIYDTHATNSVNPYLPDGTKVRARYDQFGNKNPHYLYIQNGNNRKANLAKIKVSKVRIASITKRSSKTRPRSRPKTKTKSKIITSSFNTNSNKNRSVARTSNRSTSRSTTLRKSNISTTNSSSNSLSSSNSFGKTNSRR